MEWLQTHVYASTIAVASLFVILGCLLVVSRTDEPTPSGMSAWNGNTSAIASSTPSSQTQSSSPAALASTSPDYGIKTLPYTTATSASATTDTIQLSGTSKYNFNALIAELSNPALKTGSNSKAASEGATTTAWNFIPTGLISIQHPSTDRTALQQSLYLYGNEVGSLIEGYDARHGNQTQVLTDANNDRQNAAKQAAVVRIGQDLELVGSGIADISDAPSLAQPDNTALSNSYLEIGKKLVAVGNAEPLRDSALVSAIESYDSSVNSFNKVFIALASLFSANGVNFSSNDPGSVFSFKTSAL